mmetsp:Transcript_52261/g.164150  ORF Transcript_52261/g.164150 Transcript_52261/m.164150 type:complete len:289 (+) Transcript_52261:610-1476(+)
MERGARPVEGAPGQWGIRGARGCGARGLRLQRRRGASPEPRGRPCGCGAAGSGLLRGSSAVPRRGPCGRKAAGGGPFQGGRGGIARRGVGTGCPCQHLGAEDAARVERPNGQAGRVGQQREPLEGADGRWHRQAVEARQPQTVRRGPCPPALSAGACPRGRATRGWRPGIFVARLAVRPGRPRQGPRPAGAAGAERSVGLRGRVGRRRGQMEGANGRRQWEDAEAGQPRSLRFRQRVFGMEGARREGPPGGGHLAGPAGYRRPRQGRRPKGAARAERAARTGGRVGRR